MTQGSDQAGAAYSSWPPSGAAAAAPTAAGAMTLGSILTVAGILLLFVFFAAGLISLQYCFNAWDDDRDSRLGHHQGGGASVRRRRRGGPTTGTAARGVDPDLLRSLPVTVYRRAELGSDEAKAKDAALDCAVCLAELEDDEEARFLPRCGHGFHADCVDMWLASHTTCPLCRLTVAKPDDDAPVPLLHPVPHEPANYAGLPASVLLGLPSSSDDQQGGAVTMSTDATPSTTPSTAATTAVLVIDIPETMMAHGVPLTTTPRDTLKSPASARLRSIRRLWSFGRQQGAAGPSSSSSCSCAGAGEDDDLEQGTSVTLPKGAAAAGAARPAAAMHSVAPDGA